MPNMDSAIVVATIAAGASIVVAIITAMAARKKTESRADVSPSKRDVAAAQSISGNTISAGGNVTIKQVYGTAFEVTDTPSAVMLDTIGLEVRRRGTGFYRDTYEKPAVTLTIALTNPGADVVLVPKVELLKVTTFAAVGCSFPNDAVTAATFGVYERHIALDDAGDVIDILEKPLQLQQRETFGIRLGLTSRAAVCYEVKLRVYWKLAGSPTGQTAKSEAYLINFGTDSTTWRTEVKKALLGGSTVFVSLGRGWRDFADYARDIAGAGRLRYRNVPEVSDEEFILIDQQAVIIPELPPRDRYMENTVDRRGLLIVDRNVVAKYERAVDATSFSTTIPSA
jgi:hypothetical protein